MRSLKDKILKDGRALNETVLKVDSFLNHQVDAKLMYEMGTYFKEYFKNSDMYRYNTKAYNSTEFVFQIKVGYRFNK